MTHKKFYEISEVFYFNEDKLHLWYPEVHTKGFRPYILLFTNVDNTEFIFVPLMSKYNSRGVQRIKSPSWKEANIYNVFLKKKIESYILLDRFVFWNREKVVYSIRNNLIKPTNTKVKGEIRDARIKYINFFYQQTKDDDLLQLLRDYALSY